jgi:hypothetical protein
MADAVALIDAKAAPKPGVPGPYKKRDVAEICS